MAEFRKTITDKRLEDLSDKVRMGTEWVRRYQ